MATETAKETTQVFDIEAIGEQSWLDQPAELLGQALNAALRAGGEPGRRVKDFFNGIWLGHPLHPALTDVPIGAWWLGALFDITGPREAADRSMLVGVIAAVPTALAGLADWQDTFGRPRRVGVLHALLNSTGLGCFIGSLVARRAGSRGLGVGLSTIGLAAVTYSAWLGGELIERLGTGVDRNVWSPEPEGYSTFKVALKADDLPEGQLTGAEIELDGQKVPLVLLRRAEQVYALGGTCAHWGGPLAEGTLVGETCVQCPWHASIFDMRDGSIVHGPAAFPQPLFEARIRTGNVEVRRVR